MADMRKSIAPAGNVVIPQWQLEEKRRERAERLKLVQSTIIGSAAVEEEAAS